MLLLLFDIDGTLLQRASGEHAAALRAAAGRVHGVDLSRVDSVEYAGRTDRAIARDLLAAAGVEELDEAWVEETVREYERLCPPDLSATVAPGMVELLDALAARPDEFRLALVTGNLEPVARRKLGAAGIGHYFEPGQGGFGSDDEDRGRLPAIARGRASDPAWPRGRTVVIGDTPRDIHCARVDEVRVAAVATGSFGVEALAEADAVVDDARSLLPVLEDWR
ncbi:haloacid dehalogenase-like hydrolase [Solirubrobacter sp. CPCC 204708]|uniref:Haloacid dehalogenase-like hydrolase n=1 Tax=Solirubrobacter deserti TaxID=2282478 RepID=A0ABT4RR28_9ACTN|nr:haloacid dehalogenase-like hydrolase [Solirubrobacter deserti]MBE2320490.1 haloacid dehalogenase-like hydrolase [Solirubrobacter deserti]MDA0140736.1 haloacid dehalogenase-like hydrolase [Solirubrobacter deserti]